MYKTETRRGFTLAEVLVTLAIIGVVAALTIPTLIQSANAAKYTTGLKKQISVLSSALQMNASNNVDLTAITANSDPALAAYFSSQLNVLKDDGAGTLVLADGTKLKFNSSPGGASTMGCTDLWSNAATPQTTGAPDGLCDATRLAPHPAGVCPIITPSVALPATGYCTVYVDVNADKLPNVVSNNTVVSDIYLLGIDSQGVKPVDGSNFTIPTPFASVAASPEKASINALTQ